MGDITRPTEVLTAADRHQKANLLSPCASGLPQVTLVLVGHVIGSANRLSRILITLNLLADCVAGAEGFPAAAREDFNHTGRTMAAGRVARTRIH